MINSTPVATKSDTASVASEHIETPPDQNVTKSTSAINSNSSPSPISSCKTVVGNRDVASPTKGRSDSPASILKNRKLALLERDLLVHHDLSVEDMPGGLRERYIAGHYREPHQKFSSYLGSIFEIHNESLNIWTAILSVICIFVWFWRHCMERSIFSTPEAWPITLVAGAMITTHVASANAHTMCHHSVEYSGVFYMFDYFGITIYLYLAAVATFVYSVPLGSTQTLMTVVLVLSLFNSVAWPWFCSRALAAYRRTNELSQRPSLSTQLFLLNCFNGAFCGLCGAIRVYNLPIWGLKFGKVLGSTVDDLGGYWYLAWLVVSFCDLTVYKFHIPESLLPPKIRASGLWDIFHSHTIHHLLALASNLCHLEALETDWERKLLPGQSEEMLWALQNVSTIALIVSLSNFSVIFVLVENFFSFIRQFRKTSVLKQ
ncbi:membrane progestin receptor alpha-like [Convolutriloba macropyga]|uniref:membrane progestin receptor alpha-like n=1 Tax=Convolutriloba macropyga TaxID=536237 RepID=UPI003F521089